MRTFLILVTLRDGTQCEHDGLYADGFCAIDFGRDHFPDAKRISARRLP